MNARTLGIPLLLLISTAAAGCIGQGTPTDTQPTQTSADGADPGQAAGTAKNTTSAAGGAAKGAGNNATSAADVPPEVKTYDGTVSGAGNPQMGFINNFILDQNFFMFDVGEGATAVVLEIQWAGADKLYAYEYDAKCEPALPNDPGVFGENCEMVEADTDGTSPVRIVVTDEKFLQQKGKWSFVVGAEQSPMAVTFKAATSVFYGGLPVDAYTALAAPAK